MYALLQNVLSRANSYLKILQIVQFLWTKFPCRTGTFTRLCLFVPYGRDIASFQRAVSPYKRDTEWPNERFHGSTSIVLQEAPQLTTPPVFLSNDQSSTPHPPSAILQRTCHGNSHRSNRRQQVSQECNTLLFALFWPLHELLRSPFCKNLPLLARFRPSGDFLAQTTLAFSFLRKTTVPTFFGHHQHGLTFRRPVSQHSHFL